MKYLSLDGLSYFWQSVKNTFYSATNQPPYPVTSVNGQTGDVTVAAGGAVTSVNNKTGAVTLTKSDVGLGSVDNTADANKSVYNSDRLGGLGLSQSGNRYGVVPWVLSDGGMDAGQYIDFHTSDGDTGDFIQRMSATSDGLILGVKSDGSSKGIVGKTSVLRGYFGYPNSTKCNLIAQCFTSCLGNGYFRFDISGKWYTAAGGSSDIEYGISIAKLRQCVYHNIYGSTDGSLGLDFNNLGGEIVLFNASTGSFGTSLVDYGFTLEKRTNSIILARIYQEAGTVGGWGSSTVNSSYPGGFWFKGTLFARLT